MTHILTKIKDNILKIGSICACAVLFFLFGHNAHATITYDIEQTSANTYRENWILIGQNFVASSTDLTGVSVIGAGGDFYADFYLCKGKVNNAGEVYAKRNCDRKSVV